MLNAPETDAAIKRQRVTGGENDPAGREHGRPCADLERADNCQKFTDKTRRTRQPDIGHGEQHEDCRIDRHAVCKSAIGSDLTRVHPVINHTYAQKQRA